MVLTALCTLRDGIKGGIDDVCEGQPAWKIVLVTAGGTVTLLALKNLLFQDESLYKRSKNSVFRLLRKVPAIRRKIETELEKINAMMLKEMNDNVENSEYIMQLPEKGWDQERILKETERYCSYGKCDWSAGYASGTVYNGSPELTELMTRVYEMSAWTNPLHPDVFPGIRKMEAEVVRMCCNMFNGGPESCGTMTTGGTESIVMACKAYRDYAVKVRHISKPEMVVPITAHAAFDKGAQLLNIRLRHVPVDPVSKKVDIRAMRSMITRNTCMLVGSTPHFPHGVIDPIEEISALGVRYGIPVHVDACLGGFLIPFMEEAGYPLPLFDFRLPGVCSVSCDTHKYGFAPKGSSVVLYKNKEYRHHQFFAEPNWPGGIYTTPTISGSRSGGIIAACWAAMMYYGRDGYISTTKAIIETARKIEQGCRDIPNITIVGKPDVSVVAISSDRFNIYTLSDGMGKKGWNLNALQFPPCIHIAVTVPHTKPGVAERFIKDVSDLAAELSQLPRTDSEGSAALYGMAQSLPDRSIVEDIACVYLDASYDTSYTKKPQDNGVKV
uniref:sphinganine-1-phosphate aldolase n=1 Tax=Hirondellea gigas TaxID=1518452 RepID=A0A2P2I317_9CRUS